MLIDLDSDMLFGIPTYNIIYPLQREFTSKDKSLIQKYIGDRFEYLTDHRFGGRLNELKQNLKAHKAEALDRDSQQACKHGAKSVKILFQTSTRNISYRPSILEQIDWGASKHTANLVLEGEYDNEAISLMAKEFVQYMKRKALLDEIPVKLNIKIP